jgi:hypothetical protein
MKNQSKQITTVLAGLALTIGLTLSSCKKPEKGETGPKGETGATGAQGQAGPQAKTFNFILTFAAGDTYQSYSGITGFNADDVIMVYKVYETLGTTKYWTQLPWVVSNYVNIVPEFSESTGLLFINTEKADGTVGSPWTTTNTFDFKAVLISSSQRAANPNINWKNYTEVKKVLKLKD